MTEARKRPPGRPKSTPTALVTFRMEETDVQRLKQVVQEHNLNISNYIKMIVLERLEKEEKS